MHVGVVVSAYKHGFFSLGKETYTTLLSDEEIQVDQVRPGDSEEGANAG